MLDLLKKSLYATVGLAVVTTERVEEIGKKFIDEAKMSETEGKKFLSELIRKSQEGKDALEKLVNDAVDAGMKKMNMPTRKEMNDLDQRIRALELKKTEQEIR